jgi:hypothetical protein
VEDEDASGSVTDGVRGDNEFPPEQEIVNRATTVETSTICKIRLRESLLLFLLFK